MVGRLVVVSCLVLAALATGIGGSIPARAAGSNILVVSADCENADSSLINQIKAQSSVGSVSYFDGQSDVPSLATMETYTGIVVFSDCSWYDQTVLGDNLAAYEDAGGKVIAFNFDWFGGAQSINGNWMSGGYSPFDDNADINFNDGGLGIYDATDPLMQGVTILNSHYRESVTLAPGAHLVASWDDGTPMIASLGNAVAVSGYIGDSAGHYSGNWGRLIANALASSKVDTTSAVTSSANPSVVGQSVTFTATVTPASGSGTPSGTVEFQADGTDIDGCASATLTGGTATCATSALSVAHHTITATYGGDSSFNGSNGSLDTSPQVVTRASPTLTSTASATAGGVVGSAVLSDTATLSGGYQVAAGVPAPTISFSLVAPNGSTVYTETQTVTGDGSYTPTGTGTGSEVATQVGTYTWQAHYSGNDTNNAATDDAQNESVSAVKASPSISSQASATAGGVVGGSVLSDSATLSAGYNPTGTITFYLFAPGVTPNAANSNNVYSDVVSVSGNGTYTTASGNHPGGYSPAATGTYQWVVVYSGDGQNNGATSPFGSEPWTVSRATPTLSTTATPAQATVGATLNDSATLSGGYMPAGTITFYLFAPGVTPGADYSNNVYRDVVTVSGAGTFTTASGSNLGGYVSSVVGTYQWIAVYSGDANNLSATGDREPVVVQYGIKLLSQPKASGKAGSAMPIKIELTNAAGQNLSSAGIAVNALCVMAATPAPSGCSGAPMSFGSGSPFAYDATLAPGGGYQLVLKTSDALSLNTTYELLFRAQGEPGSVFHADGSVCFTLTK